jgi:hypothetical protein
MRALLFSQAYRHVSGAGPLFCELLVEPVPLARIEAWKMRQLRALLHKTPSRIARRIAEIVAIAAASLPAAGA